MDKRGDLTGLIFGVAMIFVFGIIVFLFSHINETLLTGLNTELVEQGYTEEPIDVSSSIINVERSHIWDYSLLFIYIGLIIALIVTAFSIRVHPIFFWVYIIMSMVILVVGVILSNVWIEFAEHPEFAATIERFPITNFLLGSYAPIFVTAIMMISIVFIFGKTQDPM